MAANNGLPPKFYDFDKDKVLDPTLKLKDHGNEIVLGLAEAYAMAVDRGGRRAAATACERESAATAATMATNSGGDAAAWQERASRWEAPLARMFAIDPRARRQRRRAAGRHHAPLAAAAGPGEAVRQLGVHPAAARSASPTPPVAAAACRPQQIDAIEAGVDRIARAVFAQPVGLAWSGGMDSEADAVESAIYIAAYRPACARSARLGRPPDRDALRAPGRRRHRGGRVPRRQLHSHVAAVRRRAHRRLARRPVARGRHDRLRRPTRAATPSSPSGAAQPYSGVLRPPQPRHRTIMKLPWNWARLNSWPEWYVIDNAVQIENTSSAPPAAPSRRRIH